MLYLMARRVADFICPPSALDLAKRELEDARRELLEWEKAKEDADAMSKALHDRIKRLHSYTASEIDCSGGYVLTLHSKGDGNEHF